MKGSELARLGCFSDLERSLGIATSRKACVRSPARLGFSDLERSLGIATVLADMLKPEHFCFSDLERSLGIATAFASMKRAKANGFQ